MAACPANSLPPNSEDGFARLQRNPGWAIFWVSVVGLFLEMLLIRWIGTEIRIFAYLQNTVLVVCFLGLGMGCFTCRRPIRIRNLLVALLLLTGALAIPVTKKSFGAITEDLSLMNDFLVWFQTADRTPLEMVARIACGLLLTFLLMAVLWEMFVPLGRILGRLMDDHPSTIWAYSVNVAGSLIGIWLFVLASALYLPPWIWFLAAGVMLWSFLGQGRERMVHAGMMTAVIGLAWIAGRDSSAIETVWSPYQKLVLKDLRRAEIGGAANPIILVNNVGFQDIRDLRPGSIFRPNHEITHYDLPTMFKPNPNNVLLVGSGAGNDVAGLLRGNANQVTAVEIDPAIIRLGRARHPERPYDNPRVTIVNDDARSFFTKTKDKYDLIVFGYLDSHTTTSLTNARLDHYVYTRESIRQAKSLLNDGGVVILSFAAAKPYIADRIARVIREEFGSEPIWFSTGNDHAGWGATFVTGDMQVLEQSLASNDTLRNQVAAWRAQWPMFINYTAKVTTDDWPYLYLESPRIPTLFFLLGFLMLGLVIYGNRRCGGHVVNVRWQPNLVHFFCLGAAFMLLEVQSISKAAVAFGNTWSVNAVIISAIMVMILLANLLAARWSSLSRSAVSLLLIGSCLGIYFVDLSLFAGLPFVLKSIVVGGVTTLPMLFSGIVFIRSFAEAEDKSSALGANLLGALVGGLLQSVTYLIGIKALLLIVTGLYLAALLTQRSVGPQRRATASPALDDHDNLPSNDVDKLSPEDVNEPALV